MSVQRSAGDTSIVYDPETAEIRVTNDTTTLAHGTVRVVTNDESLPHTADRAPVVTDDGCAVQVTHEAPLETTVCLASADDAVEMTVSVTNTTETPVSLEELTPIADAATPFDDADYVFEHGYQSWTPTATLALGDQFPAEPERNRPQMLDLAAPSEGHTSHYLTALTGDPGHATFAFLDHEAYLSRFDIAVDTTAQLSAVCPGDGVTIPPGGTRRSATLRIDATREVDDAIAAATDAVGDRMDARVPDDTPTGWCSWYHYFTGVTEADIRTNVDALNDWDVPVDVVQIDDGYETAFGDWRTLAEGFSEMDALVDEIAASEFRPGIWLAPFYVQADSDLAAEHPEWLVTDADGVPVDAGERHGPMYGLDTTHPEARTWLQETFKTIVDEWGFSYLKLDFLYAAALPGVRHDDVTRAEAYRRGLKTIRAAVGDDVTVLGCGAPMYPSVGLVDAMRVGPDTAPYWRKPDTPNSEPAHENAIRNVLNRQFCHRRLWLNDPDCQLVRETTDLTAAERRSFAALVALSGGSNVFSDALSEIDDTGRALLERTLPPITDGKIKGVGRMEFPDELVAERATDDAAAVATFNWSDSERTVRPTIPDHIGEDVRCWDAFTGELVDPSREYTLAPHDATVLHCVPARSRPHPLAARHLANAADQLTGTEWSRDGQTASLEITLEAPSAMELVIAVPEGWAHPDAPNAESLTTIRTDVEPGQTTLQFTAGDQA